MQTLKHIYRQSGPKQGPSCQCGKPKARRWGAAVAVAALTLLWGGFEGRASATTDATTKPASVKKPVRKSAARSRQPVAQTAPTRDRITEIQEALGKAGAYQGDPSGKWDAATTDALSQFQTSQGLTATGKLDAPTLQKLGLGSDTAGRAAPLPRSEPPAAPQPQASNAADSSN